MKPRTSLEVLGFLNINMVVMWNECGWNQKQKNRDKIQKGGDSMLENIRNILEVMTNHKILRIII